MKTEKQIGNIILETILGGLTEENLKKLGFKHSKGLCCCVSDQDSYFSVTSAYELREPTFSIIVSGSKMSPEVYKRKGFVPESLYITIESKKRPANFKGEDFRGWYYFSGEVSDKTLRELYKSLRTVRSEPANCN